jgi:hypothetical protein
MALTFEYQRPVEITSTGVTLWLMPALVSGVRSTDPVEVARAPDSSGSPGTWETIARIEPLPSQGRIFADLLPWTTAPWWYRYRHVRANGAVSSAWSTATQHSVKRLPRANENVGEQRLAMAYRATPFGEDGKFAVRASDSIGSTVATDVKFVPENGVFEGGVVHKIFRHREEITVLGGDADGEVDVTFAQTYQNPPMIALAGGQYLSYSTDAGLGSGVKQRQRIQAINVTASGFRSRAQLVAIGALTPQSDNFTTETLTAEGQSTNCDLTPGGANDDTYTVHYSVVVNADQELSEPGSEVQVNLTVAIESNDGGGWTERATFVYNAIANDSDPSVTNSWTHEQKVIVVTGLATNDDIRLRAKTFSVVTIGGSSGTGSFNLSGGDSGGGNPGSFAGVTYNTTAGDTIKSAIPDTGDSINWVAQEVA